MPSQYDIANAEFLPVRGYMDANMDVAGNPMYFGFLNKHGHWYIKQTDLDAGTVLYARGAEGYPASWNGRSGLTYAPFNDIFNT